MSDAVVGLLVSPAEMKTFLNLPSEIKDDLLKQHLESALRRIQRETGVIEPLDNFIAEWQEALIYLAYATVLPHLNTFFMTGAGKALQMATQVEAHFHSEDEVRDMVNRALGEYERLLKTMRGDIAGHDVPKTGIWMTAI